MRPEHSTRALPSRRRRAAVPLELRCNQRPETRAGAVGRNANAAAAQLAVDPQLRQPARAHGSSNGRHDEAAATPTRGRALRWLPTGVKGRGDFIFPWRQRQVAGFHFHGPPGHHQAKAAVHAVAATRLLLPRRRRRGALSHARLLILVSSRRRD